MVKSSHIFQPMKIKSKIEKLIINITLIYENDNYYELKNSSKLIIIVNWREYYKDSRVCLPNMHHFELKFTIICNLKVFKCNFSGAEITLYDIKFLLIFLYFNQKVEKF